MFDIIYSYRNADFSLDISESGTTSVVACVKTLNKNPKLASYRDLKKACRMFVEKMYFDGYEYIVVGAHKESLLGALTGLAGEVLKKDGDVTYMRVSIEGAYNVHWS